jgi:hypothetical protein
MYHGPEHVTLYLARLPSCILWHVDIAYIYNYPKYATYIICMCTVTPTHALTWWYLT